MEKITIKHFISFIISLICFLCAIYCLMSGAEYIFLILAFILFIFFEIQLYKNVQSNLLMMLFLGAFFTFLMGSELLQVFYYKSFSMKIDNLTRTHLYITLFLSIVFLYLGYLVKFKSKEKSFYKSYQDSSSRAIKARNVSLIIFYCSYVIYLICALEQVIYVSLYSYNNLYIDYASKIPTIIRKLGDICPISFYVFLATTPTKRQCRFPIILMLIYSAAILLTGKRFYAVAFILILFFYFMLRNYSGGEKWLKKRHFVIIILLFPIICSFAYWYGYARVGASSSGNFIDYFIGFFYDIGKSTKTIVYGYLYRNQIPSDRFYCFGNLYDYLINNEIVNLFFDSGFIKGQNVDYALQGHSFSYIVSYLALGNEYLSGSGLGSCYIAEAYHDLGYFGVVVVNFALGCFIRNFFTFDSKHIWKTALSLYCLSSLFLMPRGNCDSVLCEIINIKFIVYFALIYFLSKSYKIKRPILIKKETY